MTTTLLRAAAAAAVLLAVSGGVSLAHVSLDAPAAPAGSTYKAVFGIGHGCDGSPTTTVRVQIPLGVTAVKPVPKSGWEIAIVRGPFAKPFQDANGNTVSEGVTEVMWTGGSLSDEHFDEFAMRLRLPNAPDTTLYFPVTQECVQGALHWDQIPGPGQDAHGLMHPAAQIRLLPKAHDHAH